MQQQLPGKVSLTAAYVGTLSHNLPTMIDGNSAPYSTAFGAPSTSATSVADRRQYDPCVGACPTGPAGISTGSLGQNILLITNQTGNYHALQVSANKQLSHNISVSGFYVWSHAMQSPNESAIGQMTAQDFGNFCNPFTSTNNTLGAIGGGLKEEIGPMDADRRNNAVMSALWDLEYFHGNKVVKQLANGWTISPIVYLTSGGPFTITTGSTKNFDSAGANRPDAVPGVNPVLNLRRADRDEDILIRLPAQFIGDSLRTGHPPESISLTLLVRAGVAAEAENWEVLARISEPQRANSTYGSERLRDVVIYDKAFATYEQWEAVKAQADRQYHH